MRRSDKALGAFIVWFASAAGVWQTAIVVLAVCVAELVDQSIDPHAFALMAVLTVYSAVTQPALARAGKVSGDRIDKLLERIEELETTILERMDRVEEGMRT